MRKIHWESWNVKEEDFIHLRNVEHKNLLTGLTKPNHIYESVEDEDDGSGVESIEIQIPIIATPFGAYQISSVFKPSDRWDCWIGHTNFRIGGTIFNILNSSIPGIEALSIMGAYTFCIGIAKLFDSSEVKQQIENTFCEEQHDKTKGHEE